MVNQKYKVKLAGRGGAKPARVQMSYEEKTERVMKAPAESYNCGDESDPNAQFCIDPALRCDIQAALLKVTNHSASAIARTLQYQIVHSNWDNMVELREGLTADSLFEGMNFCLYVTDLNPELYDIRLAAIDMV